MALSPCLSYIRLRNAHGVESVELILHGGPHHIPKRGKDFFSRDFDKPLMLPTEKLSLLIGRRASRFGFSSQTISESISINSIEILCRFRGKRVEKKGGEVSITLGILCVTFGVMPHIKPISHMGGNLSVGSSLGPTTKHLIEMCPRFRILLIGKSGVGKASLVNRIFGIETRSVANQKPGEADIEQEFTSPENDRLILHDSRGFEPADGGSYDAVKSFIEKRKNMPDIKDQLHAVWLCFQMPIPTYGERLLEDGTETLLKMKDVLGNTPMIVVFTKYDRPATFIRHKMRGHPEAWPRFLQEFCIQPIHDFTGDKDIAHVAVSSKPGYEQSLEGLIRLTQEKVSESFTFRENQVSPVSLAAAEAFQPFPTPPNKLKVDLSIDVGKQRYWKALCTFTNFPGHNMQDCLGVIHTEIVTVWNFFDPCKYLDSKEFRGMMMHMVNRVDLPVEPNPPQPRRDPPAGTSRNAVPLAVLRPIIWPLNACFILGKWIHQSYQRFQGVPTKFMAYIVDLTHVLKILFSLTARMRAKKLTRRTIKSAYQAYDGSEWMWLTHTDIMSFQCSSTARDKVLRKITLMLSSGDGGIQVRRTIEGIRGGMPGDLEEDEEWVDRAVSS